MGLHAFLMGVNAVCMQKEGHKYGMICAWAQMVDHNRVTILLGAQSDTGKNLQIGDRFGISALTKRQKHIALLLGENHSQSTDKFANIDVEVIDDAIILIPDARSQLCCRVENIIYPNAGEADRLVFAIVEKALENRQAEFLDCEEVLGC